MILTYKNRIKDGGNRAKYLQDWSKSVNLVWNYLNEASFQQLKKCHD